MSRADEFAKLFFKLSKDYKAYIDEALAPYLTEGQLAVLEVALEKGKVKPSDFLPYLSTTPAAVTTLLDRMEKNGLIQRVRDEHDRRVVWVHLTEKGKREGLRGIKIRERYFKNAIDLISEHNQQLLIYLLGKVTAQPDEPERAAESAENSL